MILLLILKKKGGGERAHSVRGQKEQGQSAKKGWGTEERARSACDIVYLFFLKRARERGHVQ